MKTKYNTGDEVLVPVKIKAAMKIGGEIYYIPADYDEKKVIPEGLTNTIHQKWCIVQQQRRVSVCLYF